MSRYEVNSLLYRLKKDRAFRTRFNADPEGILVGFDLSEAERSAFVARDMRRINALGGYLHLVMSVPGLAAHTTHTAQKGPAGPGSQGPAPASPVRPSEDPRGRQSGGRRPEG